MTAEQTRVDAGVTFDYIERELSRPADGWAVDARDMQPIYNLRAAITELLAADREYDEARKDSTIDGAQPLFAAMKRRAAALAAFAPQRA